MSRKLVTVPLSKRAMHRLDYDKATAAELNEINLSDSQFDELWRIGFLDQINTDLGTWIAHCEDETITGLGKLILLLRITEKFRGKYPTVERIHHLVLLAVKKNTGVFFYF